MKADSVSLFESDPDIAAQAFGWDPQSVTRGSAQVKSWWCPKGHSFDAAVKSRVRGRGCNVCAGKVVLAGFNDLLTSHPQLASEAHGWDPTTVSAGMGRMVEWKCPSGHIYQSTILNRKNGNGCGVCAGQVVIPGVNDLATTHPEIALQAFGWDPTTVTSGSHQIVNWMCSQGHQWPREVKGRTHKTRASGCPYCSGRRPIEGETDLATSRPDLAAEADGWDPTTVSARSNRLLPWRCHLGHAWKSTPNNRQNRGCPTCGGKRILIGFNDLQTTSPEIAAEAFGWNPTTVTSGSHATRKWKCTECSHAWSAQVKTRMRSGCPACTKTGFNPGKDGYLYLLEHDGWEMLQIGITNVPKDRLASHRRLGWRELDIRGPMDGVLTRDLESDLLKYLKSTGAAFAPVMGGPKFDGWTEAWMFRSGDALGLSELIQRMVQWQSGELVSD